MIPAIGGAPEAKAKPKPKGNATSETTKPGKILGDKDLKDGKFIL